MGGVGCKGRADAGSVGGFGDAAPGTEDILDAVEWAARRGTVQERFGRRYTSPELDAHDWTPATPKEALHTMEAPGIRGPEIESTPSTVQASTHLSCALDIAHASLTRKIRLLMPLTAVPNLSCIDSVLWLSGIWYFRICADSTATRSPLPVVRTTPSREVAIVAT